MEKTVFLLSLLLMFSCSTLVMEPAEPLIGVETETGTLQTRAIVGEEEQLDEAAVLNYYQTNHRMILMRHVELRDTIYVQTLTGDDMAKLHITPAELAFGEEYVVQLNEMMKNE